MTDNSIEYKGYIGTVEYSAEDECFIGRIHGIRDSVTFEGESVSALREDFRNAVDSYLQTCEEIGKPPQKQFSGKVLLRLPADLHYELSVHAESTGESVNSLLVEAVATLCKKQRREAARRQDAAKRSVRRKAGTARDRKK
ncbi:MAG: type II toxin-antitoxin system HicB family antitoxin [Planctomycetes bacterium]|nr:type II toxin-antitoxin system HicB family antitoxin [Planctomycetota bacterium]